MKKLFTLFVTIALTISIFAQLPQKMSYQCVIRNSNGALVVNQNIGIRISILHGFATGMVVYQETYNPNPQTNANGLLSIEIGNGVPITGSFSTINWANGPYFLKTETDPTGTTNYTIIGTSQLLSVPFAFYAKTAGDGFSGNYGDLYNKPALFDGTWASLSGKPAFAAVATSGNFSDLLAKPVTLSGYGITNAMSTAHPANAITSTNISNWTTAFGWGNHSGLYRPISYVPAWSEITSKPTTASGFGITDAVTTTGDQTINGNKSFSGTITVTTPINESDAVNKAYVDALEKKVELLTWIIEDPSNRGFVEDIEGNQYKTIEIGNRIWMAENLKVTKYNDGTDISMAIDNSSWNNFAYEEGVVCFYNYNQGFKDIYGAIYNSWAILKKKLCPGGWHVSNSSDWLDLLLTLDPNADSEYWNPSQIAGGGLSLQVL